MDKQKRYKTIIWSFGALAVIGMSYVGFKFIYAAEQSASGIQNASEPFASQPDMALQVSDVAVPVEDMSASAPMEGVPANNSSGRDVVIQAGDFVIQDGVPNIRLSVSNQGNFAVSAIYVDFSLYLNNGQRAVAMAKSVPVMLPGNLQPGANTVVNVDASELKDKMWRSDIVQQATTRRIRAHMVAVADDTDSGFGYPQNSEDVSLKQIGSAADTPAPNSGSDNGDSGDQSNMQQDDNSPDQSPIRQRRNSHRNDDNSNDNNGNSNIINRDNTPTGGQRVISYESGQIKK